jgi:hypothetical protein
MSGLKRPLVPGAARGIDTTSLQCAALDPGAASTEHARVRQT